MISNSLSKLFILILASSLIAISNEGMSYSLTLDKNEIKNDDVIIKLKATIDIDKGYYIQSSNPDLSLSPTTFEWFDTSVFKNLNSMQEPSPKLKYDKSLGMNIGKHYNDMEMIQDIIPKDNIPPGDYNLIGEFIYQICDSTRCIPYYDEINFNIKILEYNNYEGSIWNQLYSMIGAFFVAFLAGLIAIITPCVFPMIPMTVAFFAKGSKKATKDSIKQGLIFGLSIIIIFMVIGVLFSFVFGAADLANQMATSAVANIIFAIIFLVFAISFFGYFEIQIPNKLLNRINKKADGGGLLGTFFMALTLVLVSFSCTAPIVGTVMIDAVSGHVIKPIIVMLGFSLAFAIPFSLFAIFPSWLENLPQSGGWLNSVKIVLGFLELALCIKFLSMPDQAYHWGLLSREVFLFIWIIIFGAMGLYLSGVLKFKNDSDTPINFGFIRISTIVITFSFCIYMGLGLFGQSIPALAGIIPPYKSSEKTIGDCNEDIKYGNILHLPHGLRGYFDYDEGKNCALSLDKPLFLDFTGHACFNCRRMEENVWIDSTVKQMLEEDYVIIALYVDDKTSLSEGAEYRTIGKKNFNFQVNQFNSNAQPFYVLLDPRDGTVLVDPKAYDTNIESFIEFLEQGKDEYFVK
tara:strand:- start:10772 stop:12667 length:1896 start_codon:yes stop_codon:yes gene_type:complete